MTAEQHNLTGLEIAVTGMAGRFPGAGNVDEFWNLIADGTESISFFSEEELLDEGVSPELLNDPGYVKAKGMLADIDCFDAPFFGFTPNEAVRMDPQIRFFLECTWEALEDAGYVPGQNHDSIGVYAGASMDMTWASLSLAAQKGDGAEHYSMNILSHKDMLSTLVSYQLNLRGPSITVYTACSTSLVAVHQACRALLTGECSMAVAGGVTITLPQKNGYIFQEEMILSPDGHCRPFDASAEGTVFGDGIGVLVLKRLADARKDSDFIRAVILSSSVNNDGRRKVGYVAPSVEGQAEVAKNALALAGLEPESIGYIEAHGTGTNVGDPIEVEALRQAYQTTNAESCAIGSVKANVGHLDAAAGAAGLIKAVLMLQRKVIPPLVHYRQPNPEARLPGSPFYICTEAKSWNRRDRLPLRAAVNSLGIGGTNVHMILQEAEEHVEQRRLDDSAYVMIPLSARSRESLERYRLRLAGFLEKNPGISLADIAYSLQVGRKEFEYRWMCPAAEAGDLIAQLKGASERGAPINDAGTSPLIFMFSGQGSQYVDMGRDLYSRIPAFRERMDRGFALIANFTGEDLRSVLYPPSGDNVGESMCRFSHVSPLKFVFEYSLARFLMDLGIVPDAMIGHSFGEYTTACLAEVFSFEDAVFLACMRGRLMDDLAEGAMLSASLPEEELRSYLNDNLFLAAVNGPRMCLISGTVEAVEELEEILQSNEIECLRLKVGIPAHSELMEPMVEGLLEYLGKIRFKSPRIPYISSVTGTWIQETDATNPAYYVKQLTRTVRFGEGLNQLFQMDGAMFLEVSPGRGLSLYVNKHPAKPVDTVTVCMVRHRKEVVADDCYTLNRIGELWMKGWKIDWEKLYGEGKPSRVPVPTYPFQKHRYWLEWRSKDVETGHHPEISIKIAGDNDYSEKFPSTASTQRRGLTVPFRSPEGDQELQLAGMWREIFGGAEPGADDDFFQLGGDSLKALTLAGSIRRETGIQLKVADIFQNPSIATLAMVLNRQKAESLFQRLAPVEKRDYYQTSSSQRRIFLAQQAAPGTSSYNVTSVVRMRGAFDVKRIDKIIADLAARHEGLRTFFQLKGDEIVQRIVPGVELAVRHITGSSHTLDDALRSFIQPFDLAEAPLLRVGLIEEPEDGCLLALDMHHIITDEASLAIFIREFTRIYNGFPLPPLNLQYRDYADWQDSFTNTAEFAKQESFWMTELAGTFPSLTLPFDFPNQRERMMEGDSVMFEVPASVKDGLTLIAADEGATLFMVLLSAFFVFLSKICGQTKCSVGTAVQGRRHPDLESIIGVFINMLVLRVDIDANWTFRDCLRVVKKTVLAAMENQDYPFETLSLALEARGIAPQGDFFDVTFGLQTLTLDHLGAGDYSLEQRYYQSTTAKYPLTMLAMESEDGLKVDLEYATSLFSSATILELISVFQGIVERVSGDPSLQIGDMNIVPPERKKKIELEIEQNQEVDDVEFNL